MYTNPPKQGFGFGRNQSPFDDDFFSLGAPVGPGQPNRREDVIKVETILGNTGDYDIGRFQGPVGYFGEPQEKAVKSWQERNKYKVDGTLLQNGPTITGLKKQTGGLLGGLKPPTPDEVDDHHDRLGRGEPGILNTRPARLSIRVPEKVPELDEQTLAFNADSARALTRTSVDGDVPNIYANYLKQAGADGHTTVLDLVEQVNNAEGRDRAERVLHGILGQLPPDQAKAFLGGEVPAPRPIGVRMADLADDEKVPLFRKGIPQLADGGLARNNAEGEDQEEKPEQTPPTPPSGDEPPEGEEKPEDKPEDKPEEEEAKNDECSQLQDAFETAQEEMLAARETLDDIQRQLDEVESEIEEIRQLIEDAEAIRDELASQGSKDFDIGRLPNDLKFLFGPLRNLLKIRGATAASDHVSHYLVSDVFPRRSAAEKRRQDLLGQKSSAEEALERASASVNEAASAFQSNCGGKESGDTGPIA